MFLGDMILYYDKNDYVNDGTIDPIVNIMKNLPFRRVMIGGLIGPIAAFLYCIRFYHIVLITDNSYRIHAIFSFLLCCLGIIIGGTYHSHCAYLGLLGKEKQRKDLNIVINYFKKMAILLFIFIGFGLIVLAILIILNKTILPIWMVLLTPPFFMLLRPLACKLPKGIHMIVCGGFSNIVFIVYYIAIIVFINLVLPY